LSFSGFLFSPFSPLKTKNLQLKTVFIRCPTLRFYSSVGAARV
jgi:hypothetical protein